MRRKALATNGVIQRYVALANPNLAGEMQTTVSLAAVSCGTEKSVVQEGIPAIIPAEQCYLGWQQSLMLLSQLVEAEVNQ
jgi:hypothetical protein